GKDMPDHDRPVGRADAPRRFDERKVFERQGIAAYEPGERRNAEDRDRDDDVAYAAAEDSDDADGEHDAGKREQHVADAHDDAVPPALVVSRDEAHGRADDRADGDGY